MHKVRIGVLMGGKSIEKEISFLSGRTVCDHLDTARYDVIPLFQSSRTLYVLPWHFLHRGKTTDFEHRLPVEAAQLAWDDVKQMIDFMYIAQHGRYAEDGILQGVLELFGIPYLGSGILASAVRMDKIVQKMFLMHAGIQIPRFVVVHPEQIEYFTQHKDALIQKLTQTQITHYVVKPYNEGSSLGVSVVSDLNLLEDALKKACFIEPGKKKRVLIEQKIVGMEFTCHILFDYKNNAYIPLPPTQIVYEPGTSFLDYEQKYMPGRGLKITPAQCTQEQIKKIQDTCIVVMRALEFTTIARIDGFLTPENDVVIIDPNSLSGMAPSSFIFNQAAEIGMSPTTLINHLIETDMHRYGIDIKAEEAQEKKAIPMNTNTEKIRVAVLCGGRSNEKEISLESGRNVFYKLSPHIYKPLPIFVTKNLELYHLTHTQLVRNTTARIEAELDLSQKILWNDLPDIADFVFIALHGGEGENGTVQGMLEMLSMPYNGSSVLTSALCMDKYKTNQFLRLHGFDIPQQMFITRQEWSTQQPLICANIIDALSFPLIVKPYDDGCSIMVQKVYTSEQLVEAVELLFAHNKDGALIEECITGMELTVGVIGNKNPKALSPSQAIAAQDILSIEEKFLPGAGENQTPAPLSADAIQFVQKVIVDAYKIVECKGYARIDCFYQQKDNREQVIILEVNTLPGLTPATCIFHQAAEAGLKPMEFIDTIVQLGFEEHATTSCKKLEQIEHIMQ